MRGEILDTKKVVAARREEMKTFGEMKVYVHVTREEVGRAGGKVIGVRWVETEKADGRIRSRLVAQEFATQGDRDDLFAGTPPLAATKMILSELASSGRQGPGDHRLMVLDIKRAFLYGYIEDELYIELPDEDPMKAKGYLGRLVKAMYGTRAAPQVWQETVRKVMFGMGFEVSAKFPCVYNHVKRGLKVVTHVDDFLCSGRRKELKWLHDELVKEFEMTSMVVGPSVGEVKVARFLGRTIKWTDEGITYEGDDRHAKVLLKEWELEGAKAVGTPGVVEEKKSENEDKENKEVNREEARRYRRAAARVNYMALDRLDLGYAAKEVSRSMAVPREEDFVKMKRVIRYLKGAPKVINVFKWQDPQDKIVCYTDSDWAGCHKTRKSTSGGIIMSGSHVIHHWSSTQATTALSSAEAELNAIVKASVEAIGIKDLAMDWNIEKEVHVMTDSSAANGICHRRGCGKLKHVETRQLWTQELVMSKKISCKKVPREKNPADTLTHHWTVNEGRKHFPNAGIIFPGGG